MRLSRYEKETIILLNAAEDTASIYTADPVWKRKLDKLVEKTHSAISASRLMKSVRPIPCRSGLSAYGQRKRPSRSQRSRKNGQNRDCRGQTNESVLGAFYASQALFQ